VPLLTDRWADVRWIGLSICTSLAFSEQGRGELEVIGQKFVGGFWSFLFSILLDDMECGFVRQQVCCFVFARLIFPSPKLRIKENSKISFSKKSNDK